MLEGLLGRRENKGPEAWNSWTFPETVSGLVWLEHKLRGRRDTRCLWHPHRWVITDRLRCFSNCFTCMSVQLERMAVFSGWGAPVWVPDPEGLQPISDQSSPLSLCTLEAGYSMGQPLAPLLPHLLPAIWFHSRATCFPFLLQQRPISTTNFCIRMCGSGTIVCVME